MPCLHCHRQGMSLPLLTSIVGALLDLNTSKLFQCVLAYRDYYLGAAQGCPVVGQFESIFQPNQFKTILLHDILGSRQTSPAGQGHILLPCWTLERDWAVNRP